MSQEEATEVANMWMFTLLAASGEWN